MFESNQRTLAPCPCSDLRTMILDLHVGRSDYPGLRGDPEVWPQGGPPVWVQNDLTNQTVLAKAYITTTITRTHSHTRDFNNHRHTYTLTHTWLNQSNSFNKGIHNNHSHTYTLTHTWLNQSNSFNKGIYDRNWFLFWNPLPPKQTHTYVQARTHTILSLSVEVYKILPSTCNLKTK